MSQIAGRQLQQVRSARSMLNAAAAALLHHHRPQCHLQTVEAPTDGEGVDVGAHEALLDAGELK